ncbi:Bcr/CflA family drug resistance efflux transporter [Sulfuriferula plumbiphila]|uniref:Bcr/CflA family efflux transporter n=1 Tax=Sulfuriferula plumbiphila TaxID=171865 RepID=A0A512L5F6_9PROT|nr:multidrug effflux MFS transporter [Sulfuriferula plumbiphila]BBP03529.1 Bcr/CflA family drug resistance efflux transporter [Sulfuriferula plumbiphila]GEP29700.1 Bcr/CflA family drug resistance efflux transporter [Sulfuriferula plumbiphila]
MDSGAGAGALIPPTVTAHLKPHRFALTVLLAGLATLGPFSIDTYMPSFPDMGASLHATPIQLQQTLSVYLLAFALMLLLHGALSDAFGRRPVILVSLVAFVLACIGCVFSYDINHLLFFRGMQGFSAGAGMVVGRAIIRDLYAGHEAQRLMSQVTMIFGISPAIAPVIGGWLQTGFGWHSVFVFMTLLGALLFALGWRYLPETLPPVGRQPFSPRPLARNYRMVFTHPVFLLLSGAVALHFAGFFLYIASAPVFVIQHLKLGESQFAWLFIPAISGVILGAFLSGRLAGHVSSHTTVKYAYLLLFTAAGANLVYNLTSSPSLPWAVLPITLYSTGMSLAMPSITMLALDLFPPNRGLVASLQGFVQTMLNALVAGVISPMLSWSPIALASGMLLFLILGRIVWMAYLHKQRAA